MLLLGWAYATIGGPKLTPFPSPDRRLSDHSSTSKQRKKAEKVVSGSSWRLHSNERLYQLAPCIGTVRYFGKKGQVSLSGAVTIQQGARYSLHTRRLLLGSFSTFPSTERSGLLCSTDFVVVGARYRDTSRITKRRGQSNVLNPCGSSVFRGTQSFHEQDDRLEYFIDSGATPWRRNTPGYW